MNSHPHGWCRIPTGAVAGDWSDLSGFFDDDQPHRVVTWSRHDAAGIVIAVDGTQHADGSIDRRITMCPATLDPELDARSARQLAAALLDAADALDSL